MADRTPALAIDEVLAPWDADARLRVVGRRLPRVEGREKVTGGASYAADVRLPGLLYAAVLRSPLPHARIRRLDATRARLAPGVRAILSATEPLPWPAPVRWYQEHALLERTVRFVGDEVAAVAADTEAAAEDALRLIRVDYQPLPFVLDLEAALRPGAPRVHADGNVAPEPVRYSRGDPDAALAHADVVIDRTYATQTALHNCLEPHGCTVAWDGDQLTIWDSTQAVFDVREGVARALGLPEHRVRIVKQHMGGGFGSKQIAWKHTALAAILARTAGRPVQLMLDRRAENLAAGNRNATRQRVVLGAARDGRLVAVTAEIHQQIGAYLVGGEASDVGGVYQRLYRCPNVRTEQTAVFTNTGPAVAFRAPGFVEGAFALESALDELARALGLDPLELRLRNYTETDQKSGRRYSSPAGLRRCYELAAERFGWRAAAPPRAPGPRRRGIGLAAHDWGGSGYPPAYAWVKLNGDGSAEAVTGTQDIGTGTRTGLVQVVAEELGLAPDRITLRLGDTGTGPYAPVSSGSATLASLAPALREAAADVRMQLATIAARLLDAEPARLRIADGVVEVAEDPERRTTVAEVARRIAPRMLQAHGARGPNPPDRSVRTFGVQMAEVEVDTETGEVTVLRVVAAHDCGRVVNPTLVESQIVGGVTQGLGFALMEERVVDAATGLVLNADLEEYKVPTVADVPAITAAPADLSDPAANPTGAKGIGEPPIVPTAPAIANAVFDAVGVRLRELPLSRPRLLAGLAGRAGEGGAA